jgi:transcriptional regulator with AAA-type ATPase domain
MKKKPLARPKLIISWIAVNNDFKNDEVNTNGPTISLHRYYYTDKDAPALHLLLHADTGDKQAERNADKLVASIRRSPSIRQHPVELVSVPVRDVISFEQIMSVVESLLIKYRDKYTIELFISPGTPMMQVCWVLAHINGIADTRLIQARRPEYSRSKTTPDFFETQITRSSLPFVLAVRARGNLVGTDYLNYGIEDVISRAELMASRSHVNVLITGETGTGKEGLAKIIRDASPRANAPFHTINCAAFNDDLLLSELFGSVKGAYTGAIDRAGIFETLDGGTLFMDEIGDVSKRMQVALLRVLQDGTYQRVGDTVTRRSDVRIIAATNKDLYAEALAGNFRLDLYYRLAQGKLHLPALRVRGGDAIGRIILARWKGKVYQYGFTQAKLTLDDKVLDILKSYAFPGNLRELDNILDEIMIECGGSQVSADHIRSVLPSPIRINSSLQRQTERLDDVISAHCRQVLAKYGNKSKCCEVLGITVNTLNKYLA